MTKTSAFDWSQLDRDVLYNIMYLLRDKLVNQPLSINRFHDTVIRQAKKYLPIKGSKQFNTEVIPNLVYVGGTYYSELDRDRSTSIELCLCYNPKDQLIKMNSQRFKRFCVGFADTILHEVIHMRQLRKRKFVHLPDYPSTATRLKQREEQEYLGNLDEVDAYAFNIACELDVKFNSDIKKIVGYLNEDQKGKRRSHNSYRMYLQAFGHNHNHPVIKRVKKRTIYYLSKTRQGKPFRQCDWINRP
jgi:hypothetical protein